MQKNNRVQLILFGCLFIVFSLVVSFGSPTAFSGNVTEVSNFLPLVVKPGGTPTAVPTATSTSAPAVNTNVKIVEIVYNPSGSDLEGEYVTVQNFNLTAVNLNNWRLYDANNTTFLFPDFTLEANATVRIWVKAGANDNGNLYMNQNRSVWTNTGDTGYLADHNGMVVHTCSYTGGGSSATCN